MKAVETMEHKARKYGKWLALLCFVAFVVGQTFAIVGFVRAGNAIEGSEANRIERIQQLEDTQQRIKDNQFESCSRGNEIRRALRAALTVTINSPYDLDQEQIRFYRDALDQVEIVNCNDVTP